MDEDNQIDGDVVVILKHLDHSAGRVSVIFADD